MTTDEATNLSSLLVGHRAGDGDPLVHAGRDMFTAGAIRRAVSELAGALRDMGVQPGQPVAAIVTSSADAIAAMFAVWSVDAVYVPINGRQATAEVIAVVQAVQPAVVIGTADDLDRAGVDSGCVEITQPLTWQVRGVADRSATQLGSDVALVMWTSGTTGASKAVLLRHDGTIEALRTVAQRLGHANKPVFREPTPNLIPVSLALWAGVYNVLFAMSVGAQIVLLPKFTPHGLVEAIKRYRIRSTVLAPAMINMLTEDDSIDDVTPLRYVRSITAPLSPQQARRCFERFGVSVLNSYGQTELGGEVVGWTARDIKQFGADKLGAAGRPHSGIDVSIRDDSGHPVAPGDHGEVWIRSPFVMGGYLRTATGGHHPNGDDSAVDVDAGRLVDGYLRTGDLGRVDDDGFLWIDGRVSDMINRGGLKVMPDDVENILAAHPHIVEACVTARPDPRLGEVPVAWLVVDAAVSAAEAEAWCRARLAPYKVPVAYQAVDALPRSEIGKVLRRALAERDRRAVDGSVVDESVAGDGRHEKQDHE
jgi:long-chain acyl-CoA synthetase